MNDLHKLLKELEQILDDVLKSERYLNKGFFVFTLEQIDRRRELREEIDRRLKKLDYLEVALTEVFHRAEVYEH